MLSAWFFAIFYGSCVVPSFTAFSSSHWARFRPIIGGRATVFFHRQTFVLKADQSSQPFVQLPSNDGSSSGDGDDSGMEDQDNFYGQQYDEFPVLGREGQTEEEKAMLEAYRRERVVANDRWQSCLLRDNQGGDWTGSYELYVPAAGPSGIALIPADTGSMQSSLTASDFEMIGVQIFTKEQFNSSGAPSSSTSAGDLTELAKTMLLTPTRDAYLPTDFRPSLGNQVVSNAFTLCKVTGKSKEIIQEADPLDKSTEGAYKVLMVPETYVAEVAYKEGNIRSRVRYAYRDRPTAAVSRSEAESGLYDMFLVGFVVMRECLTTSSPVELAPLLTTDKGTGIYDPQAEGEPYVEIRLAGKLSLLFPRALKGERVKAGSVLTMEWEGNVMRYQVDRRFNELTDGQIRSLELTEVRAADAEQYPPGFQIKPDYLL